MEKSVNRLSLIFNDEDPEKFNERLSTAKSRQQTAENELRFWKYIDNVANEKAS